MLRHLTYELALSDGRVYRARISRPSRADTCGKGMWPYLLKDQLHATEAEHLAQQAT
jgi:hypothetical protein